jgi:geranylgeranyl diphosphate synthase type II
VIENPQLRAWLDEKRRVVEAALDRFLPSAPAAPPIVCEAMRYSVFAGGKRFRPLLTLAAAEATALARGLAPAEAEALALPAACAIELIHTYSLVHDDLPAMDNDTMRRGRPTAHVVYGDGMAILSGDALLTEAFLLMAREPREGTAGIQESDLARRRLRAIGIVAGAAGAAGMVGGQAIDLQAAVPGAAPLDAEQLRGMHAGKTGALIRGSALSGTVMAGGSRAQVDAIDHYATSLGLAFQIVDDILDVEGASADLGKTAGKDAAAGKPTYAALYGVDRSRALAAESIERALAALDRGGLAGHLPGIARWVVGRTH